MKGCVYISIFIISCSCLTSCYTSRKLTEEQFHASTINFDKITSDSVYKRIQSNQDLPFITAKGHVKFSNVDETIDGKIILYVIKDSLYLAIIKKLGIELARILITKDSLKVLDRISESYSIIAMDELIHKYKIPLDFQSIHQILTSGCFLESDIFYEFKKNRHQCILLGTSESQTLTYQLDTFRLLPHLFEAKYESHSLQVEVQKSSNFLGKFFPVQLQLSEFNTKSQIMNIQITWDEIKLEPFSTVKFVIPDYYSKTSE